MMAYCVLLHPSAASPGSAVMSAGTVLLTLQAQCCLQAAHSGPLPWHLACALMSYQYITNQDVDTAAS